MAAGQDLSAAERALAIGDSESALAILSGREDPPSRHLRAMAYRRSGRLEEAWREFQAALAAAPRDPFVANNFANLLAQLGMTDEALRLYDHALALQPGYRDAGFNKALLLSALDDHAAALALLEQLSVAYPADARVHSARGALLRRLERHDEAARAYDAALNEQPNLPTALKGRAQVALERGERDAPQRYHRAVEADPGDLGAIHGYAEALEADGSEQATAILENVLADRPDWVEGQTLLSRMKAERGEGDFTAAMRQAAARVPESRPLALALATMLAGAGRWEDALMALPDGVDPELTNMRAHYLSEANRPVDALALIGRSAEASPAASVIAARAHLRLGDWGSAARELEKALAVNPADITAWGLVELTWRLMNDPRASWLSGQRGLIGTHDIDLDETELTELANTLNGLHRTRAHPIGQSLRGGTQTRGNLFLRGEPILRRLRNALMRAVTDYVANLPQFDEGHPLLRHREGNFSIRGSWSVRLTGSGFHLNHIHPEGVISSACYIAVSEGMSDNPDQPGWLELGRPPAELSLPIEPLAMVEPRPGRVALFPSYLFHGTRPFAHGERLTVAFDVAVA